MADPDREREEMARALELAAAGAARYLAGIDADFVQDPDTESRINAWSDPMPEEGDGSALAVEELLARGEGTSTRSAGPRFFHFVMGGSTPAALGADWLTSAYDQVAYGWASSPFAARMEQVAIGWLRQLFDLPEEFGGVLTSGATMANFVGLAAARTWFGEQIGVDLDEQGFAGAEPPQILSSGYLHPSAAQAIGMLGFGRGRISRLSSDPTGCLDLEQLEHRLRESERPAIVIANAGEVNSGDFDPIDEMAALAGANGAWLHVDGAFGLFARVSPRTRQLAAGAELADSITCDAHKWLNVPYDCGFAFVREPRRLAHALNVGAPYLPVADDPRPHFGFLSPENSRRARALPVWATLRAYGRSGYREMVERHLDLAAHLAALVDDAPELERLAPVPLNIVCFRASPAGAAEEELDALNTELASRLLRDGRVYAGSTIYAGKVALRPAIVNWRTSTADVDLLIEIVREIVAELALD